MWMIDCLKRAIFVFSMYTGLSSASRAEFVVFLPVMLFIFFYLPVSVALRIVDLGREAISSLLSESATPGTTRLE